MSSTAPSSPMLLAVEEGSLAGSHNGSFRYTWNPYSPKARSFFVGTGSSSAASNVSAEDRSVMSASDASESDEDDDVLYALGVIASLRQEPTDASLQQTVARMPGKTHLLLLGALEVNESLLMELMTKERGNIVAQLVAVIGGANCANLVAFVVSRTEELCVDQSGCIAYSRIFEAATPDQQRAMSRAVVAHLPLLCTHQYGNYVVQCILKSGDAPMFSAILAHLTSDGALLTVAANKFGSHVAESFVKTASSADVAVLCRYFLRDEALIRAVAADRFGNYFVQHVLRRMQMLPACADLTQWCMTNIPAIVADSQFALNIGRALGIQTQRKHSNTGSHHHHGGKRSSQ